MWSAWGPLSHTRTLRELEGQAGIYRLRFRDIEFSRVQGKSEVIYLGETSSLRRRLNFLWQSIQQGTREPHTAGRYTKYLFYCFFGHFQFDTYVEVSYYPCDSKAEAKALQDRELQNYVVSHLEPPPANQSTPDFGLSKRASMNDSLIRRLFPKQRDVRHTLESI